MESKRTVQIFGMAFCLLLVVAHISSVPLYAPEDYEQRVQDMMVELERQGMTGPMLARSFPNDHMMRKSQRSNSLRLRFGKRSPDSQDAWKGLDKSGLED